MNHLHAAGAVGPQRWTTAHTGILWTMKWCAVGLAPVRPQVVLTQSLEMPLGKALELVPGPGL